MNLCLWKRGRDGKMVGGDFAFCRALPRECGRLTFLLHARSSERVLCLWEGGLGSGATLQSSGAVCRWGEGEEDEVCGVSRSDFDSLQVSAEKLWMENAMLLLFSLCFLFYKIGRALPASWGGGCCGD